MRDSSDGVRHVAASTSRIGLTRGLAEYVKRRAFEQLWPCQAVRVDEALRGSQLEQAIDLYFAATHERWDNESLYTEVIECRAHEVPSLLMASHNPCRQVAPSARSYKP